MQERGHARADLLVVQQRAVPAGDDQKIARPGQPRFFDGHDQVVVARRPPDWSPWPSPQPPAMMPNSKAGVASRFCTSSQRVGQLLAAGAGHQAEELVVLEQAGELGPVVRRAEHHHPLDPRIGLPPRLGERGLAQIAADDEVAQAVADEVDLVDSLQVVEHAGQRLGMLVERTPRAGIATR